MALDAFKTISNYLYKNHYESQQIDNGATSSHWKNLCAHMTVSTDKNIFLKQFGFGNFKTKSFINNIKYFAEILLSNYLLYKHNCPPNIRSASRHIANNQNRIYEFDCAKHALSLNFILNSLAGHNSNSTFSDHGINTICIIGDGYGFMGNLIKYFENNIKIISINLGKTLLFDVHYTEQLFPNASVELMQSKPNSSTLNADFTFIEAQNYEFISELNIDLFINIASMQEMNNDIINNYFKYMNTSKAVKQTFYCCNRTNKKLPDGEVTQINSYPWENYEILINEPCPWYQQYPSHRPPFWKPFDGEIRHIIAKITR